MTFCSHATLRTPPMDTGRASISSKVRIILDRKRKSELRRGPVVVGMFEYPILFGGKYFFFFYGSVGKHLYTRNGLFVSYVLMPRLLSEDRCVTALVTVDEMSMRNRCDDNTDIFLYSGCVISCIQIIFFLPIFGDKRYVLVGCHPAISNRLPIAFTRCLSPFFPCNSIFCTPLPNPWSRCSNNAPHPAPFAPR